VFQYGACGKPALHPATSDGSLTFNLSYSRGLALYAVTRRQEVGVDVEHVRGRLPHADLANRYFSAPEREELLRLPARSTMQGFFNGWTRKESCVKALGTGLVTRLDSFAVTLTPGEPARLLTAPQTAGGPRRWTLASLDTIPGYAAAVTVAGDCERILHRPWPPSTANIHGGNL
jgi:4'-phosphopantetheinyl transferase